ncbi:UTRA domain-containing protein, partial [Nonomuraea sp. NPDC004297]
ARPCAARASSASPRGRRWASSAYLRDRGVELVRARLYVEPYALGADEAELFGLPAGTPVFRWTRETRTRRGEIAELLEEIVPTRNERFYVETDLSGSADHR